jgi:CheY-like chemotaxis protein
MKSETLIIDDDKIICILHEKLCNIYQLPSPRSFTRASEALAYIRGRNNPGQSFTILLDINMPEMNGWQFLEVLGNKKLHADIYLILVSSSVDKSDREQAKSYPLVDAFISKPLDTCKIRGLMEDKKLLERTDTLR